MRLFNYLLLMLFCSSIYAYQVQPMLQEVDMTGRGSYGTYLLTNDNDVETTIEISVYRIEFIDEVNESLIPADDDFLILPPQSIIKPKSSQTFRLRYLPNTEMKESTAYRVVFDQLPLDIDDSNQSHVEFMMRFSTIVIVNTPNTKALPVISNDNVSGKQVVKIKNAGDGVLDLADWKFNFNVNSNKRIYSWLEMENTFNQRYLMPNSALIINEFKMEGIESAVENKVYLNSLVAK